MTNTKKTKIDNEFFNTLEETLDEYFPKMHEETPEKIANKRSGALMLFVEANRLHNKSLQEHEQQWSEKYNELIFNVGKKHKGETRHATALRCIQQIEELNEAKVLGLKVFYL